MGIPGQHARAELALSHTGRAAVPTMAPTPAPTEEGAPRSAESGLSSSAVGGIAAGAALLVGETVAQQPARHAKRSPAYSGGGWLFGVPLASSEAGLSHEGGQTQPVLGGRD